MNSRKVWTVSRETMSFYGVAHDRGQIRVAASNENGTTFALEFP